MKPSGRSPVFQYHWSVNGFTTIELMVTLSVMAVLLAVAAPSFMSFVTSTRMSSQANDLTADIRLARSQAAARGVRVVMCPTRDMATCSTSATDWPKGRLVFADINGNGTPDSGELVKSTEQLSGNSNLTVASFSSLVTVTFNPYGGVLPLGSSGSFTLCPPSTGTGRKVNVDTSGRPSSVKVACS